MTWKKYQITWLNCTDFFVQIRKPMVYEVAYLSVQICVIGQYVADF